MSNRRMGTRNQCCWWPSTRE